MRRDIRMRRARSGAWHFGMGEEYGPPVPITTPVTDDFFAPGEEEKMNEQLLREQITEDYRKKFMMAAAGAGIALILLLIFGRRK